MLSQSLLQPTYFVLNYQFEFSQSHFTLTIQTVNFVANSKLVLFSINSHEIKMRRNNF